MPRRLVISLLALMGLLGAGNGSALADSGASALEPVKSPVQFVLPPRPEPTLAERAVTLARKQLGVPYAWGGASPAGFDCSGLVSWVYGRLGVTLPHNSAALYAVGRSVRTGDLRPGDVLFFSGLGHVGLYIGGGRMIHAPQSGRHVEIQPLSERSGSLIGARRVVTQ
jgi:cell wall-associated NlpC family hydrolase